MDKVLIQGMSLAKVNYAVSVQPAATITIGGSSFLIAVGTNVKDISNQRVVTALYNLIGVFREAQWPAIVTPNRAFAVITPPNKTGVSVQIVATSLPPFTENDVVMAYGDNFFLTGTTHGGNSTIYNEHARRMIERLQEDVLKFN